MEKQFIIKKETKFTKMNDSKTEESGTGLLRRTKEEVVVESSVTETEILIDKVAVEKPRMATENSEKNVKSEGKIKTKEEVSSDTFSAGEFASTTGMENIPDARNSQVDDVQSRRAMPNDFSEEFEGFRDNMGISNGNSRNDERRKNKEFNVGNNSHNIIPSDSYKKSSTFFKNLQSKPPLSLKELVELENKSDYNCGSSKNGEKTNITFTEFHCNDEDGNSLRIDCKSEGCSVHNNITFPTSNHKENCKNGKINCNRESEFGNEMRSIPGGGALYVISINNNLSGPRLITAEKEQSSERSSVSDLVNYFENLRKTNLKRNVFQKNKTTMTPEGTNVQNDGVLPSERMKYPVNSDPIMPSKLNKPDIDRARKRPLECADEPAKRKPVYRDICSNTEEISPSPSNKLCNEKSNQRKSKIRISNGKQIYPREHIFIFPNDTLKESSNKFNKLNRSRRFYRSLSNTKCIKPITRSPLSPRGRPTFKQFKDAYLADSDSSKKRPENSSPSTDYRNFSRMVKSEKDEEFQTTTRCRASEVKKCIPSRHCKKESSPKRDWSFVKNSFFGITLFFVAYSMCGFLKNYLNY